MILNRYISLLIFLVSFLILLFIKPEFKSSIDLSLLSKYIFFLFILIFIHLISQKEKNFFRIDLLFILGFIIVHFQWPLMLSISFIEPDRFSKLFENSIYINYGTWLSLIGLVSWMIGYSIFNKENEKNIIKNSYEINYKVLIYLTFALFLLFLLFAGKSFILGDVYTKSGSSDAISGIAGYIYTFFNIMIILLTVIVVFDNKSKYKGNLLKWIVSMNHTYLVLISLYIFIFLFAGDRGGPLQLIIAFLISFSALVRSIKLKEFILLILIGSLVMTIIGITRASGFVNINEVEFFSFYDLTINLANSARTLYIGLNDVPNYNDFFLGKLWIGNILGMMPFSQSIYLELTGDKTHLINSANYITFLRYGLNPHTGEGTSLIVDIYLNFSSLGVVLLMFILGGFFNRMQKILNSGSNFYMTIIAVLFGSLVFYMGRANYLVSLQIITWGIIIAKLFVKYRKV